MVIQIDLLTTNTLKKFEEQPAAKNNSQKPEKDFFLLLACHILEILHTNLLKKFSVLVKRKFDADINEYYTFKTDSYF